jgi:hypothetical protein
MAFVTMIGGPVAWMNFFLRSFFTIARGFRLAYAPGRP